MPYIYKIVNDINNKIYVGKTLRTIQERWKQHLYDYDKRGNEKRPLYDAMLKYGPNHFHIEELESVLDATLLNEREKYWIEFLHSFQNGYNATRGEDGTPYADYALIYELYTIHNLTFEKIQNITNYDMYTIRAAIMSYGISKENIEKIRSQRLSKPVIQLDIKTEEILKIFPSCAAAQREVSNNPNDYSGTHISAVCRGKRRTAYGYKWKYL